MVKMREEDLPPRILHEFKKAIVNLRRENRSLSNITLTLEGYRFFSDKLGKFSVEHIDDQ